jgi:hypothetical protein
MKSIFFILVFYFPIFSNPKNQVIQKDFFGTEINWTSMQISLVVSETIPRVIIDTNDPDYGKSNTAYNISEARNKSLLQAKETIKIHFARSIETIQLNENFTIKQKIEDSSSFREKYNEFYVQETNELKVKYIQDEVKIDSRIHLVGKKGLMSYLEIPFYNESFPDFQEKNKFSKYTGLIVDARHLDFKPSLLPKILSDQGLEIYSNLYVKKATALQIGLVSYQRDYSIALKDKRVGYNPYYILAQNSLGKNKTNLSIPHSEAVKILSSEDTKMNLKECKVIILLK